MKKIINNIRGFIEHITLYGGWFIWLAIILQIVIYGAIAWVIIHFAAKYW